MIYPSKNSVEGFFVFCRESFASHQLEEIRYLKAKEFLTSGYVEEIGEDQFSGFVAKPRALKAVGEHPGGQAIVEIQVLGEEAVHRELL